MNDKTNDQADAKLASAAKTLFNDSVESLDAATLSTLNRNRQQALEQAARSPLTIRWQRWLPAAGLAAGAVLAVMLWTGNPPGDVLPPPTVATDLDIILEVDDFEMLEDLEFYSWIDLEESPDANVG